MSLNHEFAVVACKAEAWKPNWLEMVGVVKLRDDVLRYMLDSLAWFPSVNASTRRPQLGLNTWGETVITADGAAAAGNVFRAWSQLFALAPARLNLRGPYGWADQVENEATDPPATRGSYQRLEFERDDVCASLLAIAAALDKVSVSEGHLCLLHRGV